MTALKLTGGCLCGAVRYEAETDPIRSNYCHCRMCQKHFGGPFGMYASVLTVGFRFTKGKPKIYRSSDIAERGFCADCGSPLTFQYFERRHRIALALGSFDAPKRISPEIHDGVESQLPWLDIQDGLPRRRTDEDEDYMAFTGVARDRTSQP